MKGPSIKVIQMILKVREFPQYIIRMSFTAEKDLKVTFLCTFVFKLTLPRDFG
jgi:hypothetical protein